MNNFDKWCKASEIDRGIIRLFAYWLRKNALIMYSVTGRADILDFPVDVYKKLYTEFVKDI